MDESNGLAIAQSPHTRRISAHIFEVSSRVFAPEQARLIAFEPSPPSAVAPATTTTTTTTTTTLLVFAFVVTARSKRS